MNTAVPQYHEVRITLTEIDSLFRELIGGPDIIDIGETMRLMMPDYFYGEFAPTNHLHHTDQDRTIAFPPGRGYTLQGQDLNSAIDVLGEIFWTLADTITNRVLMIRSDYTHRPYQCLYKFYPPTRELVVYLPILEGLPLPLGTVHLDGRAVMMTCIDTLPSYLKSAFQ